jgi:hypothetical protein
MPDVVAGFAESRLDSRDLARQGRDHVLTASSFPPNVGLQTRHHVCSDPTYAAFTRHLAAGRCPNRSICSRVRMTSIMGLVFKDRTACDQFGGPPKCDCARIRKIEWGKLRIPGSVETAQVLACMLCKCVSEWHSLCNRLLLPKCRPAGCVLRANFGTSLSLSRTLPGRTRSLPRARRAGYIDCLCSSGLCDRPRVPSLRGWKGCDTHSPPRFGAVHRWRSVSSSRAARPTVNRRSGS